MKKFLVSYTLVAYLLFPFLFEDINSNAVGQQSFKRSDLIGVWEYVWAVTEFPDGRREPQFGDLPRGVFILHESGNYSHIIMKPDLPRVKANRLKATTPQEAEQIAEGVLAHFGTWESQESAGTFTIKIAKSSFPNFDGVLQTRTILKLDASTLNYVNDRAVTTAGARAIAELRRIK